MNPTSYIAAFWLLFQVTLIGLSDQDQAVQAKYQPPISCYACSTMEYENQTDNVCRYLSGQRKPTSPDTNHPNGRQIQTSTNPNYQQPLTTERSMYNNLSTVDDQKATDTSVSSNFNQTSPMTNNQNEYDASQAKHQQHNSFLKEDFIRTRQCLDSEHFCSIVSISRVEFANEKFHQKFWALERNCSKSCNSGCMLIGERVRLRVCSQCCRSTNCNAGNGRASRFSAPFSLRLSSSLQSIMSLVIMVPLILNLSY